MGLEKRMLGHVAAWCGDQAFAISAFNRTLATTGNQICITYLLSERLKITVAESNRAEKKSVANHENGSGSK